VLADRLPLPPPASLDPVLDAAADCLARHGLSRTSMSDIARELGVVPSTVYRKVGSVENAAWLLAAREGHRFVGRLPELIGGIRGPRVLTVAMANAIEAAWAHPVFAKLLRDEADFVGRTLTRRLPAIIDQAVELITPVLVAAMELGVVKRRDPDRLARWIVRIAIAVVLAPPDGDLTEHLDEMLLPLLEPERKRR
jgi:AcrR family transcriptional regulator